MIQSKQMMGSRTFAIAGTGTNFSTPLQERLTLHRLSKKFVLKPLYYGTNVLGMIMAEMKVDGVKNVWQSLFSVEMPRIQTAASIFGFADESGNSQRRRLCAHANLTHGLV